MPNYYNPYVYTPNMYNSYAPQSFVPVQQPMYNSYSSGNSYMISVDGEMAARAWQPQSPIPPNSVIPLWDLDGQHVYFKSTDPYGRMNPIRKGRVVFDDEVGHLNESQNASGNDNSNHYEPSYNTSQETEEASYHEQIDTSNFVTKDDFADLKHEIRNMLRNNQGVSNNYNQNGRRTSGDQRSDNARGDNR